MSDDPLIESVSPLGNLRAIVEQDERACHLYLCGERDSDFGIRSVWVRNVSAAPRELDVAAMRSGDAPMNPARFCARPGGGDPLRADHLRLVWLPEGNGVALYERDAILAAIPPWSGEKGFHGYARDAVGEGPLAWALTADSALRARFAEAERYWEAWENDDPWPTISDRLIDGLERALGRHANYYAIDGDEWPPRALLRIPSRDRVVLETVGMSLLPMPNVERAYDDPSAHRRIELASVLPSSWSDGAIKRFAQYVSAQSKLPWARNTWLGRGHTIPCDAWQNSAFEAALLLDAHPAVETPELGEVFGDPVSIAWFLPITALERARCERDGSAAVVARLPKDRWREA
jgi:hypothetical protein